MTRGQSDTSPVEEGGHSLFPWQGRPSVAAGRVQRLRLRITVTLLLVSLLPLSLVGAGAWHVFHRLALDKTLELHRTLVRGHALAIDAYLAERLRALDLLANTHSSEFLGDEERLASVFRRLRVVHPNDFVDLGVINERGEHVAYVGPYDLKGKNYSDASWFRTVLEKGSYVSDVFLGHRQVPHCVVAILREEDQQRWILRATINNESLYSLVRSLEVGETGDVFVVNTDGLYQTPPARGHVLDRSAWESPQAHQGVVDRRLELGNAHFSQVATWTNNGHWLLVVQQAESEIVAPVRRAMTYGGLVVLAAVLLVLVTTFIATWHLTGQVERAKQQRDAMYGDLLRSAKLASLGEMATGLAHEINNPLATISAEQTNIGDLLLELEGDSETMKALRASVDRCKRQIFRCSSITHKMLQFGRRGEGDLQLQDVAPIVKEVAKLLEQQMRLRNIALRVDLEPSVPKVLVDATELEQVLVNLINNAMHAIDRQGTIAITLNRSGAAVELAVKDDGCGIPTKDLDKIFQPFFTTKPVGQGTGLGLAVSYGMVQAWGGTIRADSEIGVGTQITLQFPIHQPGQTVGTRSGRHHERMATQGQ